MKILRIPVFCLFFSFIPQVKATKGCFEGVIKEIPVTKYNDTKYFIWANVLKYAPDGKVSGEYFYRLNEGTLTFEGELVNKTWVFKEYNSKQKHTGTFYLRWRQNKLWGFWKGIKSKRLKQVHLNSIDTSYLPTSRLVGITEKFKYTDHPYFIENIEKGFVSYRGFILDDGWFWALPSYMTYFSTYDVTSKKHVGLLKSQFRTEEWKKFKNRVFNDVQVASINHLKQFEQYELDEVYTEKEWDSIKVIKDIMLIESTGFIVENDSLCLNLGPLYNLPRLERYFEFWGEMSYSLKELQPKLSPNSPLHRLFKP